jgi:hypothetical protein
LFVAVSVEMGQSLNVRSSIEAPLIAGAFARAVLVHNASTTAIHARLVMIRFIAEVLLGWGFRSRRIETR